MAQKIYEIVGRKIDSFRESFQEIFGRGSLSNLGLVRVAAEHYASNVYEGASINFGPNGIVFEGPEHEADLLRRDLTRETGVWFVPK